MTNFFRQTLASCILFTLVACGSAAAAPQDTPSSAPPTMVATPVPTKFVCPVTPTVKGEPPKDPNSDPFGYATWYINADKTMWAGPMPETWTASPDGNKTTWIRPAGTDLKISGRRLDGGAGPIKADIPCCYPTGFQIAGLYFPETGCWEVTATAGGHQLQFTLEVIS